MCAQSDRWNVATVTAYVAEVQGKLTENPPPAREYMTAWRRELEVLPPEWRGLATLCSNTALTFGVEVNSIEKRKFRRESILCGAGFFLILLGIVIVFMLGRMNAQQLMAICFIFALGSASFLVFLPGFLSLSGIIEPKAWLQKLEFQAGGAAAVFILIYLLLHHSLGE